MTKVKEQYPIPRSRGYLELYAEVAKSLNEKGKLPYRAREYTSAIVQSHAFKRINDPQIQEELELIAKQWYNEG
jgi:hypothetical protein